MEKVVDIRKTQKHLREKIKNGSVGIFDGEKIFRMPFENLFTIGETGSERILLPSNEEDFKIIAEHIILDGQPLEIFYKDKIVVENKVIQKGICPICNGNKRVEIEEKSRKYADIIHSVDKETMTVNCGNCGGQYQWGKPSGEVRLDFNGNPCKHNYTSKEVGRCLTQYTCENCDDKYTIDSGD